MAFAVSRSHRRAARLVVALAAGLALACALVGCASGFFGVDSDADGIHIEARGGANGSATGYIEVQTGQGICITPDIAKGSVRVKIADGRNVIRFDSSVSGNSQLFVPDARGECNLVVMATDAEGTIEIGRYDLPEEPEESDESAEPDSGKSEKSGKSAKGKSSKSGDKA